MRPLWSGAISFGLVNIPIKLYSGSHSNTLDLDMLHKDDLHPIRYARICRSDGKEVPYADIVKGYKYKNGDYVVLTDKDFESANVAKTRSIDILDFVEAKEIDTIYYEKPYYLEPDKYAEKPYVVLREALKKSGRIGIARFVLHNREHIGALKTHNGLMVLNQLRYQEEVSNVEQLAVPQAKGVKEKEIEMAVQLIDHLSARFEPAKYKDTYVEDLKRLIDEKAKGQTVKPKGRAPRATTAKDLMALLKSSMREELRKAA